MAKKAIKQLHGGGKVTVPKDLRHQLGLEDGDWIELTIEKVNDG